MRKLLALYLIVCALLSWQFLAIDIPHLKNALVSPAQAACVDIGLALMGVSHIHCSGPSFVQGKLGADLGNSAANSTSATFTASVGSGHSVVGAVTWFLGSSSVGITDDKSNTYTIVDTPFLAGGCNLATFYSLNLTNGPSIITANITFPTSATATFWRIVIDEFSGTGASFDTHAAQSQTSISGTNAMTSGSATTSSNGELIYGAGADACNAPATITPGTGFTATESGTSGDNQPIYGEYLIQPSAGATAGTFTPAGTVDAMTGVMTFVP